MRRFAIAASILTMLAAGVPSHARQGEVHGHVRVAVATPFVPHTLWAAKVRANGMTGYIFRIDARADGADYTLRTTDGLTGVENVDAYFYQDLPDGSGPGAICPVDARQEKIHSETGTICPGPQVVAWGIVVLTTGAEARFTLSW